MIFFRLDDQQSRRATAVLFSAVPVVSLLAAGFAHHDRTRMAIGFATLMTILLSLIGLQIVQSRRLNAADRENGLG